LPASLWRECGDEIAGDNVFDVAWSGWTALDGDTGVCPPCSGLTAKQGDGRLVDDTAHRLWRSHRAILTTRALVDRSRRPRWDESLIEAAADRLGFVPEICTACRPAPADSCPLCEGTSVVWRRGNETMSGGDLLRIAMWPPKR
jgi:hypothetical protein